MYKGVSNVTIIINNLISHEHPPHFSYYAKHLNDIDYIQPSTFISSFKWDQRATGQRMQIQQAVFMPCCNKNKLYFKNQVKQATCALLIQVEVCGEHFTNSSKEWII